MKELDTFDLILNVACSNDTIFPRGHASRCNHSSFMELESDLSTQARVIKGGKVDTNGLAVRRSKL